MAGLSTSSVVGSPEWESTCFLYSPSVPWDACVHACVLSKALLSCLTLCNPMDSMDHQASLSMGFSRQEYWSELPFPSPGDLPDPGIEICVSCLLHRQAGSLLLAPPMPWTGQGLGGGIPPTLGSSDRWK